MDQLLWLTQLERTLDNLRYQPEEIDTQERLLNVCKEKNKINTHSSLEREK